MNDPFESKYDVIGRSLAKLSGEDALSKAAYGAFDISARALRDFTYDPISQALRKMEVSLNPAAEALRQTDEANRAFRQSAFGHMASSSAMPKVGDIFERLSLE